MLGVDLVDVQSGLIGFGFVILVDQVKCIVDELISIGKVLYVFLGVQVINDKDILGVKIVEVVVGGVVVNVGVLKGVVVIKVDDCLINSVDVLVVVVWFKVLGVMVVLIFQDFLGGSCIV